VVGLDVHATQTHACALTPETGELEARRLGGPPIGALELLEALPAPILAVYEAGPTGFVRHLAAFDADFHAVEHDPAARAGHVHLAGLGIGLVFRHAVVAFHGARADDSRVDETNSG
jgi:hypothetical protein